ncbi:PTS sugar transporter subunit IIA [Entomohabitans teleogrylli]|uniref:PTS sugar transporter subunit IIA n=1 Tax=Entomohabitans teleogrylli TaxID=1384589 RepID=UPI00073D4A09|nr:PTS sugar transporter subunit IIA [Entomohabitans teleogrylli]
MLGWVIACHNSDSQVLLAQLETACGPLIQCRAVSFWSGLSSNMLSRMMCDALHETDSGEGVIFLTDVAGAPPYRVAALLSHKHPHCEVIAGVSLPLLEALYPQREALTSERFRDQAIRLGGAEVTSLWHQQQKNPPFVLHHHY